MEQLKQYGHIGVLVVGTFLLALIVWCGWWNLVGFVSKNGAPATIVITLEESKSEAVTQLLEQELISSRWAFALVTRLTGRGEIAPGAYQIPARSSLYEVIDALELPQSVWVTLSPEESREDRARIIGEALGWDSFTTRRFMTALSSVQWDHYNANLVPVLADELDWSDTEAIVFASASAFFTDPEFDLLNVTIQPGQYLLSSKDSLGELANQLVLRSDEWYASSTELFSELVIPQTEIIANIDQLVTGQIDMLPDLVPLPPSDIKLIRESGERYLLFTTTYWNQGKGALELRADPKTRGIVGDVDRNIFQRIYQVDGSHRDRLAGTFMWHQEHLHYHFEDFIDYQLELLKADMATTATSSVAQAKTTFCIRDVDSINTSVDSAFNTPTYRVCGKERQGISLGWGDTYYYSYPDQRLPVTGLPAGVYRLSFTVNPRDRFEETRLDNNYVYVDLRLDVENNLLEVLKFES